jgi:TolB protein
LRFYEIYTQRLVLGRAYLVESEGQLDLVVRRFCSELMEALAGNGEFFRSKLAFVRKEGLNKEIWSVSPFGTGLKQLTFLSGLNLSPNWSSDGKSLVFTHVDGSGHRIGFYDVASGSAILKRVPGNSCISPAYSATGELAVSLDFKGNPDIYLLDGEGKVRSTLVENWAIDISPTFDAKGEKMAFVSSRFGNPHIFLLNRSTGEVRRITYEGKYNTAPSMSPDGKHIAFSRMLPEGHRIFVTEVATGRETQITFGPGNDESPAFATDGYFLAFSSNRNGVKRIYLTNRFGEDPRMVPTGSGEATSPAWVVEP